MNYIGKEFVSRDGYKCRIIEDAESDSDKIPSSRRYVVEFEDGFRRTLLYGSLKNCQFTKHSRKYIYTGARLISEDGYPFSIVEMNCARYKLKFEDGYTKTVSYCTLVSGVHRYLGRSFNYIGKKFISADGYECEIIEDMDFNSDIQPTNRKYKVKFGDDVERIISYPALYQGKFRKNVRRYIDYNLGYKTLDGYSFRIIEKVSAPRNLKAPSSYYLVKFEDGMQIVLSRSVIVNSIYRYQTSPLLVARLYNKLCSVAFGSMNGYVRFTCNCCKFKGIVHSSFIEKHMLGSHLDKLEEVNAEILKHNRGYIDELYR